MDTTLLPAFADHLVTVAMGLGLAATCGLRAFLPLLLVAVLGLTGRVELGEGFGYLGTWPAVLLFGTATVAEILGDKFPGVDHALDGLGSVLRPAAGAVTAASVVVHVDPLTATAFGLIGGSLTAASVLAIKAKARAVSSAVTGGLGNVAVSVGEDALAGASLVLVVLAPLFLAAASLLVALGLGAYLLARRPRSMVLASY